MCCVVLCPKPGRRYGIWSGVAWYCHFSAVDHKAHRRKGRCPQGLVGVSCGTTGAMSPMYMGWPAHCTPLHLRSPLLLLCTVPLQLCVAWLSPSTPQPPPLASAAVQICAQPPFWGVVLRVPQHRFPRACVFPRAYLSGEGCRTQHSDDMSWRC